MPHSWQNFASGLFSSVQLEQVFLDILGYDLVVKGSEYAKYYFILRTLVEEIKQDTPLQAKAKAGGAKDWGEFPLKAPITAENMIVLQRNSAKAEIFLKDRHEREFIEAVSSD